MAAAGGRCRAAAAAQPSHPPGVICCISLLVALCTSRRVACSLHQTQPLDLPITGGSDGDGGILLPLHDRRANRRPLAALAAVSLLAVHPAGVVEAEVRPRDPRCTLGDLQPVLHEHPSELLVLDPPGREKGRHARGSVVTLAKTEHHTRATSPLGM